jgi:hypothetical protein
MTVEIAVLLLVICGLSILVSWVSINARADEAKRLVPIPKINDKELKLRLRRRKHLRMVRKDED